jgi:hypothetical protein
MSGGSIPKCPEADAICDRYNAAIADTRPLQFSKLRARLALDELDAHHKTCKACKYETGKQK